MTVNRLPKVSVCVPTFNAAATIRITLASILAQSYQDFEVVVSDNASQDLTLEIVRQFRDPRVRIEANSVNIGGEANSVRCIDLSRGAYTAIFHADDVYHPYMLAKAVAYLDAHPEAGAVLTEATLIDEADHVFGSRVTPRRLWDQEQGGVFTLLPVFRAVLRHHNFLITPSAVVRTAIYKAIKPFDTARFGSSSDLDVWLQILTRAPIGILREPLISYRISHAQGSTHLIRQRTDRADFFKVLDVYKVRPDIAKALTPEDHRNLHWLEQSDRVARALATFERGAETDLRPLLAGLFTWREAVASLHQRPRIAVCYLIATVLSLGASMRIVVGIKPVIRLLRRLAKV